MAARYWVGGGANTNWITAGNWAATSGGTGGATIPTSADDVIFNGIGVNANGISTISAVITVLSINITAGFTGTIQHNTTLSITGDITLNNNHTITGNGALNLLGTSGTLTSNGRVWPNSLNCAGGSTTVTKTLADNWTIGTLSANSLTTALNGNTIYLNTALNMSSGNITGT